MRIGSRLVGPSHRTFIVAEAGVNHDGSVDKALAIVDAAGEAGADAVKFQLFRAADLTTAAAPTAGYQRAATAAESQREMLCRLELPIDAFRAIRDHCLRRVIMFLATPFGLPEVERLVELEIPAIKIASTDLNHAPLVRRAADTGAALILSTGAAQEREIGAAVNLVRSHGAGGRLVLLHCVSTYPTPLSAINLRAIHALRQRFRVPCGLSDHTLSTRTGAWAVAAGADVLEKHVTLDTAASGPDHAMSLDPTQLREYVRQVRDVESALGDGRLGITAGQEEVRQLAGRSVVATADIRAGTRLTRDLLSLKRPGTGLAPWEIERITGRYAAVDIPADALLTWEMVR